MKTIDSHNHFWVYDLKEHAWIGDNMKLLRRDFMPCDLKPGLDKNNVEGTVAVQAAQTLFENSFLLDLAAKNPFIKGVVGWVDLNSPEVEKDLEFYADNPFFVGVRHIIQDEPDDNFMLRDSFINGVKTLKKYGLTYDLLINERQLPNAIKFCEKVPDQQIVLDHIAKPLIKSGKLEPWKKHIKELSQNKNLHCKLSGLLTEANWLHWKEDDIKPYLDHVFEFFTPERLFFGSDWPVCLLAAEYGQVIKLIRNYIESLPSHQQAWIMGNNAHAFYNLR